MQKKLLLHFILLPLGIALLLAGLFFENGTADAVRPQIDVTQTPDRLAQPTLPASPSQADHGAQVYWLSCMPCHGDTGQGLTDEFRATYPPEEEYCWESGCHGANPYESGFTLPRKIPGVVGESTLAKFTDAAQLNTYIRATMPYWDPGSLAEEDAWSVTAFILRQNNLWQGTTELGTANAADVKISRAGFPTPVITPQQTQVQERGSSSEWGLLTVVFFALLILLFIFKKIKKGLQSA